MCASDLYKAYSNLYDEVRLIGMKVTVAVTDVVGNATTPSLQIYTAFDRRHGSGEAAVSGHQLKAFATSQCATAVNNNIAKIVRSIYAQDLIEKIQYVDSDHWTTADQMQNANTAWVVAGRNPNFFCPSFHLAFGCPTLDGSALHDIHYSLGITYYCAFRNPKYGGAAYAERSMDSKSMTLPDVESLDGDADAEPGGDDAMADADGDGDVDAQAAVRSRSASTAAAATVSKKRKKNES